MYISHTTYMPLYYKISHLYKIDNHPPKHVCDNMLFNAMIIKKDFLIFKNIYYYFVVQKKL
jgi:hypothetical protein